MLKRVCTQIYNVDYFLGVLHIIVRFKWCDTIGKSFVSHDLSYLHIDMSS